MEAIHVQSKMSSEMKVEVIARETVLPSSPTPHPFPIHSLSYFDHVVPDMYVRLLLLYPNDNTTDQKVNTVDHQYHSLITERSKLLKTSLSETLSHFYPFAGIIVSHNNVPSICCNGHGAAFIQTRVNCPASKAFGKYHNETLNLLIPNGLESTFESTGYLLLVQANFFECGGVAIGVSISHKIADGFTLRTFICSWAAISLGSDKSDVLAFPTEFGVPALVNLPQSNFTNSSNTSLSMELFYESCATRRFVFDASNIISLKSIAASATVPNPTRVEVVSALIWKCSMEASKSKLGSASSSVLSHAVNMRKLMRQPNLMGNCCGVARAKTYHGEVNLQGLVAVLREGLEDFKVKYGNGISRDNVCKYLKEHGNLNGIDISEMHKCSSWCRFDFYEANFGWGKPLWVSTLVGTIKNVIVLLDTRDGEGIEAILSMKEEDMAVIETNKELLAYASPDPNII